MLADADAGAEGLASFLLGTDGAFLVHVLVGPDPAAATADHPWDRMDVGTPTSGYALAPGGAYVRSFT